MNLISSIVDQPTYETERMVLRPIRKSDVGLIEFYASDIRIAAPMLTIPHPMPPGAAEAFVEACISDIPKDVVWVLDGSAYDMPEVLGTIGMKPLDRDQVEIGYWLGPAFWQMGLAREAISRLLAENPLGCRTVFAEVLQNNLKSARLLTDLGFDFLGDAETFCLAKDAVLPTWTYSLTTEIA